MSSKLVLLKDATKNHGSLAKDMTSNNKNGEILAWKRQELIKGKTECKSRVDEDNLKAWTPHQDF